MEELEHLELAPKIPPPPNGLVGFRRFSLLLVGLPKVLFGPALADFTIGAPNPLPTNMRARGALAGGGNDTGLGVSETRLQKSSMSPLCFPFLQFVAATTVATHRCLVVPTTREGSAAGQTISPASP
jgi:hypothetical protein